MARFGVAFAGFVLVSVLSIAGALAQTKNDEIPVPRTLQELEQRIGEILTEAKVPGASIAVVEDNQIVLTKGFGLADLATRRAVTPQTIFRAGSISKTLAAIGVMMLVEEGKLALDAKLSDLMPELVFENPWEATDPVRLVHLIEHTSGFDDIDFRHYLLEGKLVPLSRGVELYGPYKSRWKPGTRASYANSGPVIAGRIIEKVTGQDFPAFMAARLTGPLGMASAQWTREPQIEAMLSKSYKSDGVTEEPFVEILGRPAGSLNVTPHDLARIVLLMNGRGTLDGRSFLKAETVARMERPETHDGARAGLKFGYGLALAAYPGAKAVFYGHDGGIDGFVSKLEYAPDKGAGMVVMANAPHEAMNAVAKAIKDYLERDWTAVPPQEMPIAAEALETLAGPYQSITPRQQKLAIIGDLFAWQWARVETGSLHFNGTRRIHLGNDIFQREDRAAPNIIFVRTGDDVTLYSTIGADRKVPWWELAAKAGYGALFTLSAAATLLFPLIWIPGWFRGRLRDRGGLSIRVLPFLAMLSALVLAGVTVLQLADGDLAALATPSPIGWTIYGASIAVPAMAIVLIARILSGAGDAGFFARLVLWANAGLLSVAGITLYAYDWIGIKMWA